MRIVLPEELMLTTAEREFYDVWFREDCGYPATYAIPLSHSRGIIYDHYARMWPFYKKTWNSIGGEDPWHDAFPPVPENPEPPCPWATREAMEARLEELETGPFSHLTYQKMRDYMLQS